MAYWIHTQNPIGQFVEKEAGNYFEFSNNDEEEGTEYFDWPHKVWVGGRGIDFGFRYARVLKTVVYIVLDEDDDGEPVVDKWYIKNKRDYVID